MLIDITTRGKFGGGIISITTYGKFRGSWINRVITSIKTFISKPIGYFFITKTATEK